MAKTNVGVAPAEVATGVRIRDLRTARRWSQAALGKEAGVARNVVNTAERGLVRTRPENLAAIAGALGVNVAELTGERPARVREVPPMAAGVSGLSIAEVPDMPGMAALRVDRVVSNAVALEIYRILSAERVPA